MKRSQLALGAVALVLGFGMAAVPGCSTTATQRASTNAARGNPRAIPTAAADPRTAPPVAALPAAATPEQPAAPAASPAAAVQAFLRAEADSDFATSYGLLAVDDRAAVRSRASWTAAHVQLPVVRGFTIGAVRETGTRAEVDTRVDLRPELGPVVGLVPATRRPRPGRRSPRTAGGASRCPDSTLAPEYPEATTAPVAARAWVADRRGCPERARAAGRFASSLLTDELCDAYGPFGSLRRCRSSRASSPIPSSPLYGPDVFTWAQVVPVTLPGALAGAVLAPLGPAGV